MDERKFITKCTLQIIAENGYKKTDMQMIIDKTGLPINVINNYYNNIEDILSDILNRSIQQRVNYLQKLEQSSESSLSKLEKYIRCSINKVEGMSDFCKILSKKNIQLFYSECINKETLYKLINKLAEVISKGQELGELSAADANSTAFFIICALYSYMSSYIYIDFNDRDLYRERYILNMLNTIKRI